MFTLEGSAAVLDAPRVRPSVSRKPRPHPAHPEVAVADPIVSVTVDARTSWFETLEPPMPGDWDALGFASGNWLDR